jgi:hypothetical protein
MRYYRENPDEPISHDWTGAEHAVPSTDRKENKQMKYKISEDIHAITIVPEGLDPDDYAFNRVKPVLEIPYETPDAMEMAKRILTTINSFSKEQDEKHSQSN